MKTIMSALVGFSCYHWITGKGNTSLLSSTSRPAPLPLATRRVTYLTNRKQGLVGNSASQKFGWPESEKATIGKYTWKLDAGEC